MATCLNILLVEDHDALRLAIKRVLEDHGHQVYLARCAEDLFDAIGDRVIDLYLLDLNLPGEDGLVLSARLRESHPQVGIIIMTARSGPDHMAKGFMAGADIYLAKPIAPSALLAAIDALSRRLLAGVDEKTGITLDSGRLRLSGPAGHCGVSAAEASLLMGFIRATGHRLEVDEIVSLLMDGEREAIRKSTMEVRIVRLRKKLQEVGAARDCLRSLRLRGYQLCVPVILRS